MDELKLYSNVFIETNLVSNEYDCVIIILYPEECKVELPRDIQSYLDKLLKVDKHITKLPTVSYCEHVSGGRIVVSPIGKITPYHDARVVYQAAKKGMQRALDAGAKKPLVVVKSAVEFADGALVTILGALEALYVPLQVRERKPNSKIYRLGLLAEDLSSVAFEKTIRTALAMEKARILTRDIGGGDPERMTPSRIVDYVKEKFALNSGIDINVIEDEEVLQKEYPLLAAVNRAASTIDRHKARIVELVYKPSDVNRITETVILVGKGVTYDTGGADIKTDGKMKGMSRDKCGAAAVAGFIQACSSLKPPHIKAIGVLCLCRNSVGENSYVADEVLISRSGKSVRVINTDAEGRLAMADALFKAGEIAEKELNPHIYTIATLTGHAMRTYGPYTAAMDNHSAKATNHAQKLQLSSTRIAEAVEVSTIRPEDLDCNDGKAIGDDLVQIDMSKVDRHHQLAAGFMMKVANLDSKSIKYTHLDIAGSAGMLPDEPTAAPILTLCHTHKVIL